jgi:hypothetical protein
MSGEVPKAASSTTSMTEDNLTEEEALVSVSGDNSKEIYLC